METEKQTRAPGFEEAYREQRLDLLRLAYLMCGSHAVSEDVVQAAFTAAHDRWGQIENPRAYLKRSVVNLVKDGQRRSFRLAALTQTLEPPLAVLPPDVDETWALISRLPKAQRAVIVLHYYEASEPIVGCKPNGSCRTPRFTTTAAQGSETHSSGSGLFTRT